MEVLILELEYADFVHKVQVKIILSLLQLQQLGLHHPLLQQRNKALVIQTITYGEFDPGSG